MAKTATKEQKNESSLKDVFALWKKESKNGKQYFTGSYNGVSLRGFYNTKKQNPNEPDIRIFELDGEGNLSKEEFLSMWCNVAQSGNKYLSGKLDGKWVVAFINTNATKENNQPYVRIYWSEEAQEQKKKPELIPADDVQEAVNPF